MNFDKYQLVAANYVMCECVSTCVCVWACENRIYAVDNQINSH